MASARRPAPSLDPARFLFDPGRWNLLAKTSPDWEAIRLVDREGVLSFEAAVWRESGGWRTKAAFIPDVAASRELDAFWKEHGIPIQASFERVVPEDAAPEAIHAKVAEAVRKTVENMHMVQTVIPTRLPPFPLEYLESPDVDALEPGADEDGDKLGRWSRLLARHFPGGRPRLDHGDRMRVLRCFMTDPTHPRDRAGRRAAMEALRQTFARTEWPREDWARDCHGIPSRPPSLPLVLIRLTGIQWMNEMADVYEAMHRVGGESAFDQFVSMLAALPEEEAVHAGALLVDWLLSHLNAYPLEGLGHGGDRVDFITTRLVFERILNPFYRARAADPVARRLEDLPRSLRLLVLRALRNGFLHESRLPAIPIQLPDSGAATGDAADAPPPVESIAPLYIFPEAAGDLLAPLVAPETALAEAVRYGLARSIADGREWFSEKVLRRNIATLEDEVRRAAPAAAADIDWQAIEDRAVAAVRPLTGSAPCWEDLAARDQSYITPAELAEPAFVVLEADWRARIA
jgi:hypothetical protein